MNPNIFINEKQLNQLFDWIYSTYSDEFRVSGKHIKSIIHIVFNVYMDDEYSTEEIQCHAFHNENKIGLFFGTDYRMCLIKTRSGIKVFVRDKDTKAVDIDKAYSYKEFIAQLSLGWLYDLFEERIEDGFDLAPEQYDGYTADRIPWIKRAIEEDELE